MFHPTTNNIYLELRRQIIERVLLPGTKLSENSLAKRLNVSRTPIREILRRLESEGLVTCLPYKGARVNSISIEDIDQIYTIKIYLEGLAGKLATPIISKDAKKLKSLGKICNEMEVLSKKGNIEAYIRKNDEFHSQIWRACANDWLIRILENLNSQIKRFIVKSLHIPHRMETASIEHLEIFNQLKTGNGRSVEKAIANHFKKASENLKGEILKQI